jgi:hypothetical protein
MRMRTVCLALCLVVAPVAAVEPPSLEPPRIEPPSIDPPKADAPHISASDEASMSMTRTMVGTVTPGPTGTADSKKPRVTVRPHQPSSSER